MSYPIEKCRYPSDVERIMALAASRGVLVSALEAEKAWEDYSDSTSAGWMCLDEDDDNVWSCLPEWLTRSNSEAKGDE